MSSKQSYRKYLEVVGEEIDRRHPGVFEWRFGMPSVSSIDGLIVTKEDIRGYVFISGASHWSNGQSQGGVVRRGARHSYSASIVGIREVELSGELHSEDRYLESRCSDQATEIVDWLVDDWAFERPWIAPDPVDPKRDKKRLEKIAEGLKRRADVPVIIDAAPATAHNFTSEGKSALVRDVDGLLPDQIRDQFPADKRGAIALKTTVLLARYESKSPPAQNRMLCLAAVGPKRRSEAQEIRICLEALIPSNQDHCWGRERWHADSAKDDPTSWWGAPVPVAALASGALRRSELAQKADEGTIDAGDKAALAILLQDEGRLLESLELYGIELDDDLKRLCGGQKIYPAAGCAYADEKWVQRLHDWMRACAPWLLERATRREAERIATWAAAKKSRQRRYPLLKLFIFPGQHHSRKACLMLTSLDLEGRRPSLEIHTTGSNTRLHESAWKRPLEIDFARYQV